MPFGSDTAAYQKFFEKLKKYDADPENFVAKKVRYDDLIHMKQTFLHQQIPYYTNNFLFTEDIGFERLTTLLLDIMREGHNDVVNDALDALKDAVIPDANTSNQETAAFDQALNAYASKVQQVLQ